MSYIVLARKWRPKRFEDVIGQEHVTRTLMNALQLGRIGHAFIFAGPRGVGKTTTARLLARSVNCERQPAVNPCGECDQCRSATESHSIDLIEIDGASHRGIDEIRNLRENIRFAPASARYKIYIIDEVHMLSKEAFNALLKTLEEPPAHAIFIFATTEIHRVPLTILSRCQRFDFKRIPTQMIADQLQRIATGEKIAVDRDSLVLISRKADGCMRDATSVLDQLASFSQEAITVNTIQESLGIIGEELFFEFTDILKRSSDRAIIEFAQTIYQQGHDLMNFVHGLQEHFRDLLVTRATGSDRLLETSDYLKKRYSEAAGEFDEKDLLHYIDLIAQQEQAIKYSENPELMLELLLLKILHKPAAVDLEKLLALLGGKQPPGEGGDDPPSRKPPPQVGPTTAAAPKTSGRSTPSAQRPAPPQAGGGGFANLQKSPLASAGTQTPSPKEPSRVKTDAAGTELSLAAFTGLWPGLISALKEEKKILLASFLQDGVPYKLEGNLLEVAFDPRTGFNMNQVERERKRVERVLKEKFNLPVELRCISVAFDEANISKPVRSPAEAFEDIKNKEPVLRKIIDMFDCENLE